VFFTEQEAIFFIEGSTPDAVMRLVEQTKVWTASGWKDVAAGPPRVAEDALSWIRPEPSEDLSFTPTPGPGDSDGGDLYAP
jgi:hypothetical protein